jgi:type VI secretion system protein ImpG
VNLFRHTAEPILLDHSQYEYQVVPDATRRLGMEVYSIEEVLSVDPRTQDVVPFEPFYSFRHGGRQAAGGYWNATRRASNRRHDEGTEVFLSLVDSSGRPASFDLQSVTVRTTCISRDLPARLPFGNESGDFELEGAIPVRRIRTLVKPTPTLRPPVAKESFWRLISQFSLNYLSLVEDGVDALRVMLRLYDFGGSSYVARQIEGIAALRSRRQFAPLADAGTLAFARGTQVEIDFDEEQFVGGGVYLFASVLEYFLGQYVSMNSFCQLRARTRQRKEVLRQWPPRAGRKVLI